VQIATLLVPHDGSWMADRALACATMLHRATGACLDLLRMAHDAAPGSDPDDPVSTILDAIEGRRPDLVVMASDSWSHAGVGVDVARKVARCSPAPVLVIPTGLESVRDEYEVRRILVALDGSEQAEQALTPARALADALDADLLLLRVVTPKAAVPGGRAPDDLDLPAARRYVEALAAELQATGRRVSALSVVGEPGTMIAAVSRTQRASLIAMTTRGKGATGRSGLGGIADGSLQAAGMPLLLVPPFARAGLGELPRSARSRT
jgi:nucleotide-binding universal stress UspA family protein